MAKNFLSEKDFFRISKICPMIALEVVVLRRSKGKEVVLMTQRPQSDKYFPNMWHVPGTILRNNEGLKDAFRRLEQTEFKNKFAYDPYFCGILNMPHLRRGHTLSLVFRAEFKNRSSVGTEYDRRVLPENTILAHRTIIRMALDKKRTAVPFKEIRKKF